MKLDTVTLEVIRNALPAVANEMAADLQRTSYNMMIYEVRDYCTALLNTKGELISQNVGGVSHFVADLGVLVTDGMGRYGADGFKPGDVIITNHQAVAGQHLNNVVIYMPYFYKGELLMFLMVRAHWIDVGGTSTGFGAGATVADPWLEGLQLDQLKIYEEGKLSEPLYRVIKDNIRFPESSLGDMKSQMAACRLAGRRLDELFEKYGRDTLLAAIDQIFDETERKCRNVVSQLPDGVYEASASIDDDGVIKGEEVPIHVKVTVKSGDMIIDLSGCSAERKAAINSRTYAGARVAYKALTGPLDPVNEGSFRALKVIIPEGNIMMARFPAPMAGWSGIVPTVVDAIVMALADAMPDRVPAGHHALLGGAVVFFGTHPKTKRRFVVQSIEGGGWGGRPFEDGESGTVSVCQGDVRNGSIEGIELKCPVVVESRRAAAGLLRRRKIPRRARHRHAGAQPGRRQMEFRDATARQVPALGHPRRHPRGARRLSPEDAGRAQVHHAGRQPHPGADRRRGHRPHRRRRRLGQAAGSRSGAGGQGCRRGLHFGRRRAQALRRGGPRQHVARRNRDSGAAKAARIGRQSQAAAQTKNKSRDNAPRGEDDDVCKISPDRPRSRQALMLTCGAAERTKPNCASARPSPTSSPSCRPTSASRPASSRNAVSTSRSVHSAATPG